MPFTFNPKSEATLRKLTGPGRFALYLWTHLPLAAAAGVRLQHLDAARCVVLLPGGFRTQNPFRSTYFAAQTMAAEMSTGAPAMILVAGAAAPVSLLVQRVAASFQKKIVGPSTYTFEDVAAMGATVEAAVASNEPRRFVARSVARNGGGEVVSEFEITWTFKRR